jgi:chromosome condensin MukBEF MukE localization factor
MAIFTEFFTRLYNLDIMCKPEGFYAVKAGTTVVSISISADYNTLFMLFILGLINYCENPF